MVATLSWISWDKPVITPLMLFAVVLILYFIYLFYLLLLFFLQKGGCYIMHCYSWSQHVLGGVRKTWRPPLISLCFRAATTMSSCR